MTLTVEVRELLHQGSWQGRALMIGMAFEALRWGLVGAARNRDHSAQS